MIGFTASCFDLLHTGHVMMLKEAKSVCDYLIAGLHVDPSRERSNKNEPVQSLIERQVQLDAIKYVDKVVVYSTEEELKELLFTYEVVSVIILSTDKVKFIPCPKGPLDQKEVYSCVSMK